MGRVYTDLGRIFDWNYCLSTFRNFAGSWASIKYADHSFNMFIFY